MKNKAFYPYLFAVSPILFLYAHNIEELRLMQIVLPIVISLSFFFFFFWVTRRFIKDEAKAGIITTLFSFLFFNYGNIWEELNYLTEGFGMGLVSHWLLIPLGLLMWLLISRSIYKSRRNIALSTVFLNMTALCLIGLNLFNIVWYMVQQSKTRGSLNTLSSSQLAIPANTHKPDVYFIILDEYAGFDAIKKLYHYNNDAFAVELEKRGFYVVRQGIANSSRTERSIASTMSMRLFKEGDKPYVMIQKSPVADIFKKLGYQIIVFPLNSEAVFDKCDRVYQFTELWNLALLQTTMLRFIADNIIKGTDYGRTYRENILFIFDKLKHMPLEESPKFVYAHIVCPHAPFVFDEKGGKTEPVNYFNFSNRQYYLGQHRFMTKKVLELVDVLLKKSPTPPIIVLQSDHGQRGNTGKDRIPVGNLWQDILNTYYLPGMKDKGLHQTFRPVDTFRLIFSDYFGLKNL